MEATTVGSYAQTVLSPAAGTDTVTDAYAISDSHMVGLSGSSQVSGVAGFGAMSGSGAASATGYIAGNGAFSYFQAQPAAIAQDYITIFGSGPVNLTLHYQFDANLLVPLSNFGSVDSLIRANVYFYPNQFFDPSKDRALSHTFYAGNGPAISGGTFAGDASSGASASFTETTTVQVDPGMRFGLYADLGLFGEVQNAIPGEHEISLSASGLLNYWISFDSPDAFLTSDSGALYRAPTGSAASIPDSASSLMQLGFGLGAIGATARFGRRLV